MEKAVPAPKIIPASEHGIDPALISRGARTVVEALRAAGFDGYLVGGCVRDLLLGREPKDFDVVTDALPEQIKRVFPRARLIGRRFRLAHVRVGREIVEASTYRAAPGEPDDDGATVDERGRLLADNVFGTRDDDALRRDFTLNALYFDPVDNVVLDYLGGVADIHDGVLRVIGKPDTRFAEDPVRMLRAVRFMAKLGLRIDEAAEQSLIRNAPLIGYVPPARLFDEVLKLFHHGHAGETFDLLLRYGQFEYLFPVTFAHGEPPDGDGEYALVRRALANTDDRVRQGKPVIAAFVFASLLWDAVRQTVDEDVEAGRNHADALRDAAVLVLREQADRIAMPRRVSTVVTEIWEMQRRLELRRPRTIDQVLSHPRFRAAYDFLLLRIAVGEQPPDVGNWWTRLQEGDSEARSAMIAALAPRGQRKRRPRRRRSRSGQARAAAG